MKKDDKKTTKGKPGKETKTKKTETGGEIGPEALGLFGLGLRLKFTSPPTETLVAFKSGHYKKIKGKWKGDSVWCHFKKEGGGMVHVNKSEVEYLETFE